MASKFASGLSGGAASNNINVVMWSTGRRHVRSTVVATASYSAHAILARVAIDETAAFTSPYTIKNS